MCLKASVLVWFVFDITLTWTFQISSSYFLLCLIKLKYLFTQQSRKCFITFGYIDQSHLQYGHQIKWVFCIT